MLEPCWNQKPSKVKVKTQGGTHVKLDRHFYGSGEGFGLDFGPNFLLCCASSSSERVIARQAWICAYFVAVFPLRCAIRGKMLPALENTKKHSDPPGSAFWAGFTFKNWCKDDGAGRTHRQPKKKPQNSEHEARNGAQLLPKAASRATSVP